MKKFLLPVVLFAWAAIVGAAAAQGTPGARSFTMELQVTAINVVGLVSEGLRLDGTTHGTVTEGMFAGAVADGIDYLLIRPDGVGVVDVRGRAVHPDGLVLGMTVKGFIGDPSIMPPIAAWLDPNIPLPDTDLPMHGVGWFQTMAEEYAFVNHTLFAFTGTINLTTGAIRITYRPLTE